MVAAAPPISAPPPPEREPLITPAPEPTAPTGDAAPGLPETPSSTPTTDVRRDSALEKPTSLFGPAERPRDTSMGTRFDDGEAESDDNDEEADEIVDDYATHEDDDDDRPASSGEGPRFDADEHDDDDGASSDRWW